MTRRINPSTALICVGLLVTLLAVMFRPAGAEATLPAEAIVFAKPDDTSGATVKYADLKQVDATYDVIPAGKKSAVKTTFTGIPLVDFLKAANVDTGGVQFVRVRIGVNDDSFISLQPLNPESTAGRPPMVLASGKLAGQGALATPQLIPGQPTDTPIKQEQFVPFNRKNQELTFIPGQPGAKIMGVRVSKEKTSKGQYKLKASVVAGDSGGAMKWQWYAGEKDGTVSVVSNKSTYTTTDATTGTSTHVVNVVVTETGTGSMGSRSAEYASKKPNDGTTSKPKTTTPGTTTPTTPGTVPGTTGTPGGSPGGIPTTTPPITVPNQPSTTTPPTTTPSPTPPTSTPQQNTATDTSGIANLAQNVAGTGKLTTVSGVLLSAPTVPAASQGGAGQPLSALPQNVTQEINSLFKPVDSPDDVWPYLMAVLFALSISGAVREWVKP